MEVAVKEKLKPYQRLLMKYQEGKSLSGFHNPYLFFGEKQLENALSAAKQDKNYNARELIEQAKKINIEKKKTPNEVLSQFGATNHKAYNPILSYSGRQIDAALEDANKAGDTQAAQELGQIKEDQNKITEQIFTPQQKKASVAPSTPLGAPHWDEASASSKAFQSSPASPSTGTAMATLGTIAGVAGTAGAARQIATGWSDLSTKIGAINGASMGAAVGTIAQPGFGTLVGLAMGGIAGSAINQLKSGKHVDNKKRDAIRQQLAESGLLTPGADGNFNISLADGTQVDISGEHWEGGRTVFDPGKLTNPFEGKDRKDNKLRPYERDYTNDLEFMTGLAGDTLSMLTLGNEDEAMGQHFGTYFGLAANSNAGSRDFNKETFTKSMENMKGFFATQGIDSADKAYGLINEKFKKGELDQTGRDRAMQSVSMVFNNNFDLANQLNSTRWNGINPEVQSAVALAKPNMSGGDIGQTLASGLASISQAAAGAPGTETKTPTTIARNIVPYANSMQPTNPQPDLNRPLDQNISPYQNSANMAQTGAAIGAVANNLTNSNPNMVQK